MKKHSITLILMLTTFGSFAQNNDSNSIFVRHDRTTLKANECEWVIKSLLKDSTEVASEKGKSIPAVLLEAIEAGRLKAFDSWTNKLIPANEVYTWGMSIDTVAVYEEDILKYKVVQNRRTGDDIKQIRIYQDWYFDVKKLVLFAIIKSIEFLEPDRLIGSYNEESDVVPFCRIDY